MYLPKSKYTVSIAKPGEYLLNGENYVGPVMTTYTGEIYAGNDIRNPKGTLSKIDVQIEEAYPVVPTKRVPTEEEYQKGYMLRYFCQDKRSMKVFEISKDTYEARESGTYYNFMQILWKLSGAGAKVSNKLAMEYCEKTLPGIISSGVLSNSAQFYRDSV